MPLTVLGLHYSPPGCSRRLHFPPRWSHTYRDSLYYTLQSLYSLINDTCTGAICSFCNHPNLLESNIDVSEGDLFFMMMHYIGHRMGILDIAKVTDP